MLAAPAYIPMQRFREIALAGTDLSRATATPIRVKLLKFGAAILANNRGIRILLASHHPIRAAFRSAAMALAA